MASEKVTEVELEEITLAEEKHSEDVEKDQRGNKAEQNEYVSEKEEEKEEEKEKEKGEEAVYSQLNNPTEDVYSLAALLGSPPKQQDVYRKLTTYKRLSVILLIVCVVLLALLLALAFKLSEAQSSQPCPSISENEETTAVAEVCSRQKCEGLFPRDPVHHQAVSYVCSECGKDWHKFENSCYFVSRTRLNWDDSRKQCQELGGDLVVINNEPLQRFLTKKGLMMYWIGLRRSQTLEWTWIDNNTLTTGYWGRNYDYGDCVFMDGGKAPKYSWFSNPCTSNSHYICQK